MYCFSLIASQSFCSCMKDRRSVSSLLKPEVNGVHPERHTKHKNSRGNSKVRFIIKQLVFVLTSAHLTFYSLPVT